MESLAAVVLVKLESCGCLRAGFSKGVAFLGGFVWGITGTDAPLCRAIGGGAGRLKGG